MPSTGRSSTRAVTSGVASVGDRPVPPVVSTTSSPSATPCRSARSTGSPSGTTTGPSTAKPIARRPSTSTGPPRSSYTPAAARFEAVTTSARSSLTSPVPRPSAALRGDPHVRDRRQLVDGLDHVDERERGDRHARQGLHLDAGAVGGPHGGGDVDAVVGDLQRDRHGVHRDGGGEWHEVRRPLRRLDAGEPRHRQRVALGDAGAAQQLDDPRRAQHAPGGAGLAHGHGLRRDVDHVRPAAVVEMRQRTWVGHVVLPVAGVLVSRSQASRSPGSTRVTSSGTTARQVASARSAARCEPCAPTGVTAQPSPRRASVARAYCRRPAGADHPTVAAASTRGRCHPSTPSTARRAGRTNTSNDTIELTGLPGSVKTGVPPIVPNPCGMPGCIATLSKRTVPRAVSTSLTVSRVPALTPPLVSTRSADAAAASSAARTAPGSSATIPAYDASAPSSAAAAVSPYPLLSWISP